MANAPDSGQLALLRDKLLQERLKLLESLAANASAADTVELDQARQGRVSRIDALQQQAMAVAGQLGGRARLAAIEEALARVQGGAYGECLECGEAIDPARLAARPEVRLCIACKTRSEETR